MPPKYLTILFLLTLSACEQQKEYTDNKKESANKVDSVKMLLQDSCTNLVKTTLLSTPEKSWHALLSALQTGKSDEIKKVVTAKGYNSLSVQDYTDSNPEPIYQQWGNAWSNLPQGWWTKGENKSSFIIGPQGPEQYVFSFIKIDDSWKMDSWTPGLVLY